MALVVTMTLVLAKVLKTGIQTWESTSFFLAHTFPALLPLL